MNPTFGDIVEIDGTEAYVIGTIWLSGLVAIVVPKYGDTATAIAAFRCRVVSAGYHEIALRLQEKLFKAP